MLAKIKAFLEGGDDAAAEAGGGDPLAAAAAAVLVETALLDGDFADSERDVIVDVLATRFDLARAEAVALVDDAAADPDHANRMYSATRTIRDAFSEDERVEILEMLWRVAYADGELHDYEANLVRRTAGLLYVPDQRSGRARKRVLEDMGLDDTE